MTGRSEGRRRGTDARDSRLRRSLDPGPEAVERVVRKALDAPAARRAPRMLRAAAAVLVLLGGLALLLLVPRWESRWESHWDQGPGPEPPAEAQVSMVNVGEVVVVRRAGGGGHLLQSSRVESPAGERPGRRWIIIRKGERR